MYYSLEQLRELEAAHPLQTPPLMERAGTAAADFISTRFGTARPILCFVGPGNNGGDALVCARKLQERGYAVEVVMPEPPHTLSPDAAAALAAWQASGGAVGEAPRAASYLLVVDGLFGIGLNRPVDARWQRVFDQVNALACPVLSLDVPSGVHAGTGGLLAKPIKARWTLSFIGRARGLATGAALDYVGEHRLNTLGLSLPPASVTLCRAVPGRDWLLRTRDTHKGSYGTVRIIGGADSMVGAALLTGRAALAIGAGKVRVGLLAAVPPAVDFARPELMLTRAEQCPVNDDDILVVGPGLGQSATAGILLRQALLGPNTLVLDADALNLIAQDNSLAESVRQRTAPTIITPHPSEAARLLGTATSEVQRDRYTAAHQLSVGLRVVVLLKGAGSVVCEVERLAVNDSGGAALANAGQGDVLSGLIGGLLAQGLDAWAAANLGCFLHGAASDYLVRREGCHTTLAADVLAALPTVLATERVR